MMAMEGWKAGKLGGLCSIEIGGTPSRSNPDYWDSAKETTNRWVSIRDLNKRVISDTAEHITNIGARRSNVKLQKAGTVLLSFKLSIGRVAFAGCDLYTNEAIAGLCSEELDSNFLFYGLQQWDLLQNVDQAIKGATLNKEKLKLIEFEYPADKEEQTQIATILSTLDQAIEQTETIIAKHQRIKAGLMQDLLTKGIDENGAIRSEATHQFKDSSLGRIPVEWEVKAIGEVFTMQLGKMLSKKAVEGKAPFPYLGNKNVQWDYVDLEELLEMDFTERERQKFELLADDILVCEGGEVGRTALWRGEHESCYFQKAIHRLRPIDEQYLPKLFPRFIRHAITVGTLLNFTSQTSIAHLTQEQLATLPISVPKIEEQKRLVVAFDRLDENIGLETSMLGKMQNIKAGLMHDLLTGTVRVVNQ